MPSRTDKNRKGWRAILGMMLVALMSITTITVAPSIAAAAPPDDVQGLKGEYYKIDTNTYNFVGDPVSTVLDWGLEYDNMVAIYERRVGQSQWAGVRWTGYLTAPTSGSYTFKIIGDNGFRLWLGDTEDSDAAVIDHWVNDWDIWQTSAPVTLTAGQKVPLRMDLFQATGGANIHVRWVKPDGQEENVPQSALTIPDDFDAPNVAGAVSTDGSSIGAALTGPVTGVTASAVESFGVEIDGKPAPLSTVSAGADGTSLLVGISAPISMGSNVRLLYDGGAGIAVSSATLEAFNVPVNNASTYVMRTAWADEVDPEDPLPEYPRPNLERDRWQNLNGKWQFEATDQSFDVPFGQDLTEEVVVPFAIESQLSGIGRHEDHMIYRRTFTVPNTWNIGNGEKLLLNFGAVDYHSKVFVNGTQVAENIGGFVPFSADITDAINPTGANELVLHITDTTAQNTVLGKQRANPSGIFYTPSSGIWQTVWMEPVADASISKVDLAPNLDASTLAVNVVADGASNSATAEVVVLDEGGAEVGRANGEPGQEITVGIANPHLWTPEDPYLYDVKVTLTDGASVDKVDSYAGMRSIEVKPNADGRNRIFLNGVQTFLLSTLDQGYWPDGIYTAPTDEALAWDIQKTKDLGFNTIRKHIKVEPERWYYHADKIGMLVWQDAASAGDAMNDPADQQAYKDQLEGMIHQLQPHPSIIGWIPFNEGWGEWNREDTGDIADWVKELDSTRIVNAHSGVNCCASKGDSGRGDVIDWHMYTGPALPLPDATRASIDGEHGGFSLSVPLRVWPGGSVNPYGEVSSSAELTDAYVQNTAKLIGPAQDYLSGSVYTQITDVEGEVNGFYTYDREVLKMDEAAVRAINLKVIEVGSGDREIPGSTAGEEGIAAWNFDEGSGTTSADLTGNGHTLTLFNNPTWDTNTRSGSGYALKLDGNGDSASALLEGLDTTANYSVAAWVRLDSSPSNWATVASMDGIAGRSPFFLQHAGPNNGGYAFSFVDQRASSPTAATVGQWHHLTGVRDAEAGTLKLYIDGTEVATYNSRVGIASTGIFRLGRAQWDFNAVDFFRGAVDDVRVYDIALTAQQVSDVASVSVTPEPSTMSATGVVTIPVVTGVNYSVQVNGSAVTPVDGKVALELGDTAVVTASAAEGYTIEAGAETIWTHEYSAELITAVPTIAGKPEVGSTLTANPGTWTTGASFTYQWLANDVAISGAQSSTFVIPDTLVGQRITVTVTGSVEGYEPVALTSLPTAAVAAAPTGTIKVGTVRVTGKIRVGKTVKANAIGWDSGATLSYQWFAGGKPVQGATAKSLKLRPEHKGKRIFVRVTATKAGLEAKSVQSAVLAKVKAGKLKAKKPKIKGKAKVGSVLKARPGKWTAGTKFTYRWFVKGKRIKGANKKNLRVKAKFRGKKITVKVIGKQPGYAKKVKKSKATNKVR